MTTDQEEQDVRNRSRNGDTCTFLSHTHIDDAGGRFAAVNAATIVGQEPLVKYPAAAAHQRDPVPDEPPLGYRVDAMPELESSTVVAFSAVEATDDPACAPPSDGGPATPSGASVSERAGSSPSSDDGGIGSVNRARRRRSMGTFARARRSRCRARSRGWQTRFTHHWRRSRSEGRQRRSRG